MNITEIQPHELSLLMKKTGAEITGDYTERFGQILENLGLFSEFAGSVPVPLEVWIGIAQALADASGYFVILETAILEPVNESSGTSRIVDRRETAALEPTLFVKEAKPSISTNSSTVRPVL